MTKFLNARYEQNISHNGVGDAKLMKTWSEFSYIHYIYKNKKIKGFYIQNPDTLQKLRQFALSFIYKISETLLYAIFHEKLKLAFIYKNHDTLRSVTFLYTKRQTLHKKQDKLRYVLIYISIA